MLYLQLIMNFNDEYPTGIKLWAFLSLECNGSLTTLILEFKFTGEKYTFLVLIISDAVVWEITKNSG